MSRSVAKRTRAEITFCTTNALTLRTSPLLLPTRCALPRRRARNARASARLHNTRDDDAKSGRDTVPITDSDASSTRASESPLNELSDGALAEQMNASAEAAIRAAEEAATEAAAAAGLRGASSTEVSAVLDELGAVERAADEVSARDWNVRLMALFEDMAEHPEYYVSAAGAAGGLALGGVVAGGALAAIGAVPFLADSLRVVGLGYVFWFLSKYLLSPVRRASLVSEVKAVLRDARAPPAALIERPSAGVLAEANGAPVAEIADAPPGARAATARRDETPRKDPRL